MKNLSNGIKFFEERFTLLGEIQTRYKAILETGNKKTRNEHSNELDDINALAIAGVVDFESVLVRLAAFDAKYAQNKASDCKSEGGKVIETMECGCNTDQRVSITDIAMQTEGTTMSSIATSTQSPCMPLTISTLDKSMQTDNEFTKPATISTQTLSMPSLSERSVQTDNVIMISESTSTLCNESYDIRYLIRSLCL